ncbi:MAG: HAD family hydrolase [Lachnospiraceae bacterium]|nr:HAD family hydrolase [Lachnospiraceae bacterium]
MKAFIFDVDDTLYDQVQPFQNAYIKLFGKTNKDIDKIFVSSRKHSDEVFEASENGLMTMEEMYIYRIREALKEFGILISDERALEFQRYYQEFQADIVMTEKMKKLLSDLGHCVKMGVITNGPAQHQWDKVQALGLTKWIPRQNILVSGEAGAAKPDRKIFDLAVCKMGLDRTEAYYIGDSPANDIVGAANAGWRTIWFNRRNKKAFSIKPDYTVCSEQELCNLIMKLAGL